ncbi:MAG: wax ester/triacylglycerol synthase family O-acyltransferase [Actinobacteria bacterium]|nr:wax ester/triacylglycerol synthase family O-acyltransferase [Actinomycetota bacterium]
MSVQDATFLHVEDDVTPMHVGGAAILEGPAPDHDELMARFAGKLHLVPRYRQKVRFLPLHLGTPVWVDDPHFNLDYHVRRTALPSPGGDRELHTLVSRVMSQHLDRARPLWEIWAVEGLSEGRWALVSKVHHCMVDGVAAADLMSVVFDRDAESTVDAPEPWSPEPATDLVGVVRRSAVGALRPLAGLRGATALFRAPRRVLAKGTEALRASLPFAPLLRPAKATSLNGPIGPHRRWTVARATLEDVRAVREGLGGTINDVVLTAITGGFRDLLQARGELSEVEVVRSLVPVSVRAEGERGVLTNRVSAVFADLPVGLDDAVARHGEIRRQMDGLKQARGAVAGERLVQMAGFAPPMLAAMAGRLATRLPLRTFNTATTNVPGPQQTLYFAGRRLLESGPLIPLAGGVRIVVGIFSYDGTLTFGITGDYATASDVDVLARGIEAGLRELLDRSRSSDRPAGRRPRRSADSPSGPG